MTSLSTADVQGLANGRQANTANLAPAMGLPWHADLPTSVSSKGAIQIYSDPDIIALRTSLGDIGDRLKDASQQSVTSALLLHHDSADAALYRQVERELRTKLRRAFTSKLKEEQLAAVDAASRKALMDAHAKMLPDNDTVEGTAPTNVDADSDPDAGEVMPQVEVFDLNTAIDAHSNLALQAQEQDRPLGQVVEEILQEEAEEPTETPKSRLELFTECCRAVKSPLTANTPAHDLQDALLNPSLASRSQVIVAMSDPRTLPPARGFSRPGEFARNGRCPVPDCPKTGKQVTPKHIHSCLQAWLVSDLRRRFAETVPGAGMSCPFGGCGTHISDADALGAHVLAHVNKIYDLKRHNNLATLKCSFRELDGTLCQEEFGDAVGFAKHVFDDHGLCAVRAGNGGIRKDLVSYCESCDQWLIADCDDHFSWHTKYQLEDMDDPFSCAPGDIGTATTTRGVRCPMCLWNDELPDQQRWKL